MTEEITWQDDGSGTLAARSGPWLLNVWQDGEEWAWDVQGMTEETDDDLREGTAPTEGQAIAAAEQACFDLEQPGAGKCFYCHDMALVAAGETEPEECPICHVIYPL